MRTLLLFGLFAAGFIEMGIAACDMKFTAQGKALLAGGTTLLAIINWYVVIRVVITNIDDFWVAAFYALGCSLGSATAVKLTSRKERRCQTKK